MPLKYNHKRIKQSLEHAKMQGTYDDEDLEMEREGVEDYLVGTASVPIPILPNCTLRCVSMELKPYRTCKCKRCTEVITKIINKEYDNPREKH